MKLMSSSSYLLERELYIIMEKKKLMHIEQEVVKCFKYI